MPSGRRKKKSGRVTSGTAGETGTIPDPDVDKNIHRLCALGDVMGVSKILKSADNVEDIVNQPDNFTYVKCDESSFVVVDMDNPRKTYIYLSTGKHLFI